LESAREITFGDRIRDEAACYLSITRQDPFQVDEIVLIEYHLPD